MEQGFFYSIICATKNCGTLSLLAISLQNFFSWWCLDLNVSCALEGGDRIRKIKYFQKPERYLVLEMVLFVDEEREVFGKDLEETPPFHRISDFSDRKEHLLVSMF